LWLQQPDRVFRLAPLPALAAVYLQLKANMDAQDGEQVSEFLTQARRSIADGSCFWVDWIYPIAVPTLKPDLAAPLTFALVAAGRDPAMQAIGRAPGLRRPGIL
jgi:hypothetical protein